MNKLPKHDPAEVVNSLLRLANNPRESSRAFAVLAGGTSKTPGLHAPAFEYIEEHVVNANVREREAAYLVAAVFATHPLNSNAPYQNFGGAAQRLAAVHGDTVARDFGRLLDQSWETLPHYLTLFAIRLKGHKIPIPYYSLIRDLTYWGAEGTIRSPQVAWARQYYGRPIKGEAA